MILTKFREDNSAGGFLCLSLEPAQSKIKKSMTLPEPHNSDSEVILEAPVPGCFLFAMIKGVADIAEWSKDVGTA